MPLALRVSDQAVWVCKDFFSPLHLHVKSGTLWARNLGTFNPRERVTCYQHPRQKSGRSRGARARFPWLSSFQSTSQALSTAVGKEAVAPVPSWCQDTTPRTRRSSILCIGQGPAQAHLGRMRSLPLLCPHALLPSLQVSVTLLLRPGQLSLQLPKLQSFPTDFLTIRIYLTGLMCKQSNLYFKSFTWLRITGLNYLMVLNISQYIILWV